MLWQRLEAIQSSNTMWTHCEQDVVLPLVLPRGRAESASVFVERLELACTAPEAGDAPCCPVLLPQGATEEDAAAMARLELQVEWPRGRP